MEYKTVALEVKDLTDAGTFVGLSAVYGNTDLRGDVILPGAFTKTLQESGGKYPLLYEHQINVGVSYVRDSADGLVTTGKLNLDKQAAREAYSEIKQYHENGMSFGMSIGYLTVPGKSKIERGKRYLGEIQLFENTLTSLPLNPEARVHGVKGVDAAEELSSLLTELKAGRTISAATHAKIKAAIENLQSLLAEAVTSEGEADAAVGADKKHTEPGIHSACTPERLAGWRSTLSKLVQ
jgi:hypothetical protein